MAVNIYIRLKFFGRAHPGRAHPLENLL